MGGVQSIIVLSGGGELDIDVEFTTSHYVIRNTDVERIGEMMALRYHHA